MATIKKGTLTKAREWWKHLRPFEKRKTNKRERKAARELIRNEEKGGDPFDYLD